MGLLVNALYSFMPQLVEFERDVEEKVNFFNETANYFKESFNLGKRIAEYVIENKDRVMNSLQNSIKDYFAGLQSNLKQDFTSYTGTGYAGNSSSGTDFSGTRHAGTGYQNNAAHKETYAQKKPEQQKTEQQKIVLAKIEPKKNIGLDNLVDEIMEKPKVAEKPHVVKEIKAQEKNYEKKQGNKHEYSGLEQSGLEHSDLEHSVQSSQNVHSSTLLSAPTGVPSYLQIAELYNQGYNAKQIIKKARMSGYGALRNCADIAYNVVEAIKSGVSYARKTYSGLVAEQLGAKGQIIQAYLAGKSYSEIKQNLKQKTNGMNISDSSILRIMHEYEKKTGSKIVGMRKIAGTLKFGGKKRS